MGRCSKWYDWDDLCKIYLDYLALLYVARGIATLELCVVYFKMCATLRGTVAYLLLH